MTVKWPRKVAAAFRAAYASPRYDIDEVAKRFGLTRREAIAQARALGVRRPKHRWGGGYYPERKPERDRIDEGLFRPCLSCEKDFWSSGPGNRLCHPCANPTPSGGGTVRNAYGAFRSMQKFLYTSVIPPAKTCQWPFGEPRDRSFCGRSVDRDSYCQEHYDRAHRCDDGEAESRAVFIASTDRSIARLIREPRA